MRDPERLISLALADLRTNGAAALPAMRETETYAARISAAANAALDAFPDGDWRCDGTWFAGVNALDNDADGAAEAWSAGPLGGPVRALLNRLMAELPGAPRLNLDRAQISIVRPGYPRRGREESEAAANFRRRRDAAHVDGLLPEGPHRARHLRERHAFLLGLPLTPFASRAAATASSPLVYWAGSHHVMRAAFHAAFAGVPPEEWGEVDVTAVYQSARRRCFERLPRRLLPGLRGEAHLLHRLTLHGVAPWDGDWRGVVDRSDDDQIRANGIVDTNRVGAAAAPESRSVAYFRPEPDISQSCDWWLTAP